MVNLSEFPNAKLPDAVISAGILCYSVDQGTGGKNSEMTVLVYFEALCFSACLSDYLKMEEFLWL